MKGLLVKDLKLMRVQKNYYLVIFLIFVAMALFSEDVSSTLCFLTFIMSLFTISTISYDEFDNGNAFLFTLPITRTNYVVEKYCLGVILGLGSWILSLCLVVVSSFFKDTLPLLDIIKIAFSILPIILIIQAIMIPFQLKFGGEKGRIAIIASIGFIFVLGFLIVKLAKAMNIDVVSIFNNLPTISMGLLVGMIIAIAIIFFIISMKISIAIMNKKEF